MCGRFATLEPALLNASLHIVSPEPDGAAASQRRVPSREDDLFVRPHAQHFVRLDEWPSGKLL
jgi:hypothetical protein